MALPTIVRKKTKELLTFAVGSEAVIAVTPVPAYTHLASIGMSGLIRTAVDVEIRQFTEYQLTAVVLPCFYDMALATVDTLAKVKELYDKLMPKYDDTDPTAAWTPITADYDLGDIDDTQLSWQPGQFSIMNYVEIDKPLTLFADRRRMGWSWGGENYRPGAANKVISEHRYHTMIRRGIQGLPYPVYIAWVLTNPANLDSANYGTEAQMHSRQTWQWQTWTEFLSPHTTKGGADNMVRVDITDAEVRNFMLHHEVDCNG